MRILLFIVGAAFITGCGVSRSSFSPDKKYSPAELQKDYTVYRQILEEAHPGLYWYTSKDSMDQYFEYGRSQLNDSLTETDFRRILMYVTAQIGCGHTTVRPSKQFSRYLDTARVARLFPLSMKLWGGYSESYKDTMVVAANLNRKDSMLRRGTQIFSINGHSTKQLVDTFFRFLSTDGYNRTHKYQTLSNRGYFGSLYSSIFGFSREYLVEYADSTGERRSVMIKPFYPAADTATRNAVRPVIRIPQPSRKERKQIRLNNVRLLKIDSVNRTAMMDLNSFGRGYGLKKFFRHSFRSLHKHGVDHLIIDVRGNGGGSVTNSTLITRFIASEPFVVADSLYAIAKHKTYSRYIEKDFYNRLFMTFFTPRRKDGLFHFRYFERHRFKPKRKNHFDGHVYILTGGNSFSATTLFAGALIRQDNVTIVGEETGGGAYGNSAWIIPDVTLPQTKVRFRLPLYRLVIDRHIPKNGRGVQPEVLSAPTIPAIRRGADYKVEKAMELIKEDKAVNR